MMNNMDAGNCKKMGYSWELIRIEQFARKVVQNSEHTFSTKFMCIEDARRVMDGYTQEERIKLILVVTETPRIAYPVYATTESRLKTFQQWPPAMPFLSEEMAEEGFIYTGVADAVSCFFCDVTLRKWLRTDTVHGEHGRHFPHCAFYQMRDMVNSGKHRSEGGEDTCDRSGDTVWG